MKFIWLKKDLFFKLNYVETSCVWSDLYLLHVNAPWLTFPGFRFEEQVRVCRYVCVAEGLRRGWGIRTDLAPISDWKQFSARK